MNWWRRYIRPDQKLKSAEEDKLELIREIRKAQQDWKAAQMRFDYVMDQDQIDFSIHTLEAAEIRYGMLLRQAKKNGLSLLDRETGKVISVNSGQSVEG